MLATQTLAQRARGPCASSSGPLPAGVGAKDVILRASAKSALPPPRAAPSNTPASRSGRSRIEQRLTLCNMSIEIGARVGMVAPDDATFAYLEAASPRRAGGLRPARSRLARAAERPRTPNSTRRASTAARSPRRSPGAPTRRMVAGVDQPRPRPASFATDPAEREDGRRSDRPTWGCAGHAHGGHSHRPRLHRLVHQFAPRRSATPPPVVRGKHVAAAYAPSSFPDRARQARQAEEEGLDHVFREAGFEWRDAGCSMCIGMNDDLLPPGERSAHHVQPQFRGPPGQRQPHAPRQPGDGRCRGYRRHFVDVRSLTWT